MNSVIVISYETLTKFVCFCFFFVIWKMFYHLEKKYFYCLRILCWFIFHCHFRSIGKSSFFFCLPFLRYMSPKKSGSILLKQSTFELKPMSSSIFVHICKTTFDRLMVRKAPAQANIILYKKACRKMCTL